jgi:4-alpha-glucanotransferase
VSAFEPVDERLAALADRYGVATEYWDQAGAHHAVSAHVVRAVLRALDVDADTAEAEDNALRDADLRDWRRMLPPVFVTVSGGDRRVWVHVPHGDPVTAWIELEDGGQRQLCQIDWWVEPVEVDGVLIGEASFRVPGDLPLGWHVLHARSGASQAQCPVVMTPRVLDSQSVIGKRQWGFMTQLYATRSARSWGLGDVSDCVRLGTWSARHLGAGFLLVNPLHAAEVQTPISPSPYLPVTRRFTNPIYIDVDSVEELDRLPGKRRRRIDADAHRLRTLNASADLLDRDAVWAAKRAALEDIFRAGRSAQRQAQFDAYCAEQGTGLRDFATWCALSDRYGVDSQQWPKRFRHPNAPAVERFRHKNADRIDFFRWLQWIVDQQLRDAQEDLRAAGMSIGMVHDLAVGVHPQGADAWALQDVLARGVSVGAPPDMYNQMGQDWSQPPWRPDALAEAAFLPYRDMLRTILRHAGGLRIDHVLGLFRMWWIPEGESAREGTYVRFDHEAMVSILCLEAHRAGAIVIGEDLGTVESWVQEVLADRGILGTAILWFQTTDQGAPMPLAHWRPNVLASVTVHDLPPTAGYLRDEHVRLRDALQLLANPVAQERAHAARERMAWAELLRAAGLLAATVDLETEIGLEEFAVALHRALAASSALLLGVALPDVFGDRRAQNQPGTDQEYPNWRIPMTDDIGRPVVIDALEAKPARLDALVSAVRGTLPA